jgi:hypothetical protein
MTRTVVGREPSTGRVSSSLQASSSIRFGGRSATPWDAIVRRKSTGSPPAPRRASSADRIFAIVLSNALLIDTFPLPASRLERGTALL